MLYLVEYFYFLEGFLPLLCFSLIFKTDLIFSMIFYFDLEFVMNNSFFFISSSQKFSFKSNYLSPKFPHSRIQNTHTLSPIASHGMAAYLDRRTTCIYHSRSVIPLNPPPTVPPFPIYGDWWCTVACLLSPGTERGSRRRLCC